MSTEVYLISTRSDINQSSLEYVCLSFRVRHLSPHPCHLSRNNYWTWVSVPQSARLIWNKRRACSAIPNEDHTCEKLASHRSIDRKIDLSPRRRLTQLNLKTNSWWTSLLRKSDLRRSALRSSTCYQACLQTHQWRIANANKTGSLDKNKNAKMKSINTRSKRCYRTWCERNFSLVNKTCYSCPLRKNRSCSKPWRSATRQRWTTQRPRPYRPTIVPTGCAGQWSPS